MTSDFKELRWPWSKLLGDYARGVTGLCVVLLLATMAPAGSIWQIVLLIILFLFLAFLVDVLIRHGTRITLSPDALIRRRPLWGEDRVEWSAIESLDVRYYATRRDRSEGWLAAKIKGQKGTVTLDDGMDGFEDVMDRAMAAMSARGLGLSETTATNLSSLGLGLRPKARK